MEFQDKDFIGAGIAAIGVILSYFFMSEEFFSLAVGFAIMVGFFPLVLRVIKENKSSQEKEEMFLEFARNLVESVKTGTPVSKSIIHMADKNYGALNPHIQKLANQISLGIPLNKGLAIFARDVNNSSISRSLSLIGQAERAGGQIGEILEAVAGAVNMTDRLKKERKAAISTLVSQGYIIFLVFIVIILVLQFQIVPMVSGIGGLGGTIGFGGGGLGTTDLTNANSQIANSFLYLILTQGFFTGLVIGKLSEGNIKKGVRHSFSLMFLSFIISTVANVFFGG